MAAIFGTSGPDILNGTKKDDKIYGRAGDDELYGKGGNDVLRGGPGADLLHGGKGKDWADYTGSNEFVYVDLLNGEGFFGHAAGDTFVSIENIKGSSFGDALLGDNGANVLKGMGGNDTLKGGGGADKLIGGAGNDWLDGELGNDILKGGAGMDTFAFTTALGPNNIDTIKDMTPGVDKIGLQDTIFPAIGPTLSASEFRVGKNALDGNDYIIYNKNNGKLFYDADGSGIGAKVQFAQLKPDLNLSHTDFQILA